MQHASLPMSGTQYGQLRLSRRSKSEILGQQTRTSPAARREPLPIVKVRANFEAEYDLREESAESSIRYVYKMTSESGLPLVLS